MSITPNQQFEQNSIYSDLNSLNAIRKQGHTDQHGAMKKAANEFEAFFMNMMLKSMRQASEVIGDNPLTGSDEEKMFTGMMDEQMSVTLSQQGHLGIADLMISQLSQDKSSANSRFKVFNNEPNADTNVDAKNIESISDKKIKSNQKANTLDDYRKNIVPHQANTNYLPLNKNTDDLNSDKKLELSTANTLSKGNNLPQSALFSENQFFSENQLLSEKHFKQIKVSEVAESKNKNEKISELKPEKKSLFAEVSDFISTLLPHAEAAAKKLNLDPKILIAQAALETGWGKFIMHDESGNPGFNLFGIKAGKDWQGDCIKINTLEVENQEFKQVNASFRKYQSFSDSFNDYVNFIKDNPRYQKALESSQNSGSYVKELQSSGYATDPNYAKKIMNIFTQSLLNHGDDSKVKIGGY